MSSSGWGPENFDYFVPNASRMTRQEYLAEQQRLYDEDCAQRDFQAAMVDWPWNEEPERALTVAPYVENPLCHEADAISINFKYQNALIFNLLAVDDIRKLVTETFSHADLSALARSCRQAFQVVAGDMTLWDMSSGDFDIPQNRVGRHVLVTPTRVQEKLQYADQMDHSQRMAFTMSNFKDSFRTIHLHRVPFVNTKLLSIVVPHLTNLKFLGIYNCELIHFGDTEKLLEIVRTDKMKGKQVNLDFFPRFHVGPRSMDPDIRSGSYGVTWDNAEIDTRLAIWKVVHQVLPQARAQGVDLESHSSAFRMWLDKGPCWEVARTLEMISSETGKLKTVLDACKFISFVDYPTYKGNHEYFASNIPNRSEGWRWATTTYSCARCKLDVLGIFYDYAQIRQFRLGNHLPNTLVCLGCKLNRWLNNERDHYKFMKNRIMNSAWLRDFQLGDEEVEPLLSEIICYDVVRRGILDAERLDRLRARHLKRGSDFEDGARQKKLPVSKGKFQWFHKAPQIDEQDGKVVRRDYFPIYQRWANGRY